MTPLPPIEAVGTILTALGFMVAIIGGFLMLQEKGVEAGAPSRASVAAWWQGIASQSWQAVMRQQTQTVGKALGHAIDSVFSSVPNKAGLGTLYLAMLLLVIPVAAAANALAGGSPFLISYYGVLVGLVPVFLILGEVRKARYLNTAIAVFMAGSLFLVIPLYVAHSFGDFVRAGLAHRGLLKSVLVAPFWHVAAYSVFLLTAGFLSRPARGLGVQVWGRFLGLIALSLIGVYALIFMGQLVSGSAVAFRSWTLILGGSGGMALIAALVLAVLQRSPGFFGVVVSWAISLGGGLCLAAAALQAESGLAGMAAFDGARAALLGHGVPAGGGGKLGWVFWLAIGPSWVAAGATLALFIGGFAKVLRPVVNPEKWPFFATGVLVFLAGLAVIYVGGQITG